MRVEFDAPYCHVDNVDIGTIVYVAMPYGTVRITQDELQTVITLADVTLKVSRSDAELTVKGTDRKTVTLYQGTIRRNGGGIGE